MPDECSAVCRGTPCLSCSGPFPFSGNERESLFHRTVAQLPGKEENWCSLWICLRTLRIPEDLPPETWESVNRWDKIRARERFYLQVLIKFLPIQKNLSCSNSFGGGEGKFLFRPNFIIVNFLKCLLLSIYLILRRNEGFCTGGGNTTLVLAAFSMKFGRALCPKQNRPLQENHN